MRPNLLGTLLLMALAPGSVQCSAFTTMTRRTATRALVITDFDEKQPQREYGELTESCPASVPGAVSFTLEPAERCGRNGGCLHLRYDLGISPDTPVGFRVDLPSLDASSFDHLDLWVKGDPDAGFDSEFQVGFKRPEPGHPGLQETGTAMVSGVTAEWQRIVIPLARMTGIRDWSDLRQFIIVFHPRRTTTGRGAFYLGSIALLATSAPGPRAGDLVVPLEKQAWEKSLGGRHAAMVHVKNRLRGWPARLLGVPPQIASSDQEFLLQLARDTWNGLEALTDREHGLPFDHVFFKNASVAVEDAEIGDYTSPTNIGLRLISIVAAHELGFVSQEEAIQQLETTLLTLERLQSYRGFFFNYYDAISLERTSNFVSFVDSAWLTAGLIVVRNAFPALVDHCTRLIEQGSFRLFYDDTWQAMWHGYYVNIGAPSPYHYGVLYAESRIGSLIAIGKGDVPEVQWFNMKRVFPASCLWQTRRPVGVCEKDVRGHSVQGGYYEWNEHRYVPSWGGSMFEALMPTLVLDELSHAPASLGRNDVEHATVQRDYALGQLAYPVWGMSPSTAPDGHYEEYGVKILGSRGYQAGRVTPHAAALALYVSPEAAVADLRRLIELYPVYGEYGLYDSVDPRSGEVAHTYLALDQSMILIAVANHLKDHCIQRYFAADPIIQKALPIIADENFFD
jgi:hypothetical protein